VACLWRVVWCGVAWRGVWHGVAWRGVWHGVACGVWRLGPKRALTYSLERLGVWHTGPIAVP